MEELANTEAVAEEAAADAAEDACDIRTAPSMELCSTAEMMEVFNEYYEDDQRDMRNSMVNKTNIEASVDLRAAEFDLEISGKVDQLEIPDMDYGNSNEAFDEQAVLNMA